MTKPRANVKFIQILAFVGHVDEESVCVTVWLYQQAVHLTRIQK